VGCEEQSLIGSGRSVPAEEANVLHREIEEGVKRWHDRAAAAGEDRILAWTTDGDLHSYRRDEITLGGKYVPVVEPWWSMTIFAGVIVVLVLFSLVMSVVFSASDGQWARLFLPGSFGLFAWLLVFWARQDWDARARRRERGVPEPKTGKRPVQIDFRWPPPRMRGRNQASQQ